MSSSRYRRLIPAAVAAFVAVSSPAAFGWTTVTNSNGDTWNVNDALVPGLDTGSIHNTGTNSLQGYGGIRMWDYSGYSNYHALQTGINRRFDDGLLFSFFYVWSKALGISNDDFAAGVPNQTDAEIRRLD